MAANLFDVAKKGNLPMVQTLIASGAKVDEPNKLWRIAIIHSITKRVS